MSADTSRRTVSDAELVDLVKSHDDPVVKSSEIAREVGLTGTRVNQILAELESDGLVKSKRFGSGKGWWVPERVD